MKAYRFDRFQLPGESWTCSNRCKKLCTLELRWQPDPKVIVFLSILRISDGGADAGAGAGWHTGFHHGEGARVIRFDWGGVKANCVSFSRQATESCQATETSRGSKTL